MSLSPGSHMGRKLGVTVRFVGASVEAAFVAALLVARAMAALVRAITLVELLTVLYVVYLLPAHSTGILLLPEADSLPEADVRTTPGTGTSPSPESTVS